MVTLLVLIVMSNDLLLTGIQQLQLMLLKIALIVGVEFHINVEFVKLLEPPEDQENEGSTLPRWASIILAVWKTISGKSQVQISIILL